MFLTNFPYQRHICAFLLFTGGLMTFVKFHSIPSNSNEDLKTNISDHSIIPQRSYNFSLSKWTNVANTSVPEQRNINILGLFELSTKWGQREEGRSEMAAAYLAIKHVNDHQIVPGYIFKLIANDTKCDPGIGIDRFFHALYSNKVILMLLGTSCSNVTESLAYIMPYWNILQVSFGSTSPTLSNRNKFPFFFRTVAPDSSHNSAKISFIKYFGWDSVATLSLSQQPYLLSLNNFVNKLEDSNVTCVATITFSLDNYREQLKILKELDTRIIVGSFSSDIASKVFCEVYNLQMFGLDYIWILQDQSTFWWNSSTDCDAKFLYKAIEGLILISSYNSLSNEETSISGITRQEFEAQLHFFNVTVSKYAPQTYDAIWSMALTIRNSISCRSSQYLSRFNYKDSSMLNDFISHMETLSFRGISGSVRFDGADRIGNSLFKQIQGGNLCDIAIYYAESNFLDFQCRKCSRIKWHGGQIPIAQRILKFRLVTIPKSAFVLVLCFAIIGIALSLIFLYFNLHFRRTRTVKLSSPRLNNFVILGCILVYVAVILLGLDEASVTFDKKTWHLCSVRVYLLSAGFSLSFGSIFAKTYRVHRIFTYSGTSLIKDKLLRDKPLIGLIFMLLLVDGLIMLLWIIIDPLKNTLRNLPMEVSSEDRGIVYQPQVEVCRSQNTSGWFIVIYCYKGFLLIVGVYMAWETRHVKIPSLNDSQYIGICVYSVVSSSIVVVLSNFVADYITLSYLATALSILTSTTITLVLLFLPKLKSVLGRTDGENAIAQSMGLKVECNTRRLIFDDQRELLHRMEIQNAVYKNEIELLDKEIARLEELLASSSSSKSAISEPFTISNGSIFLPVPFFTPSRASWPSTTKTSTIPKCFLSDNKLNRPNEYFCETTNIFSKFKRFFGSIPTLRLLTPVAPSGHCQFMKKPTSSPQFFVETLKQMNDDDGIKAKSTTSILLSSNAKNAVASSETANPMFQRE